MNILPPCLCNRPQKSNWLKIQCSNCLGVLKDSQNINFVSASSGNLQLPDTFSKSIIDILNVTSKSVHKRSCTDKQPIITPSQDKVKHVPRNPSDSLLNHKPNQLSAPCLYGREYIQKDSTLYKHKNSVNSLLLYNSQIFTAGQDYQVISANIPESVSFNFLQKKTLNFCQTIHSRGITGMLITSKDCMITSSLDKTVKLWGISDKLVKYQTYYHENPVKSLATANSFFISGSTDSDLRVWDMEKKKVVSCYQEHSKPVNYIESLKVNTFLSGSCDCCIKLWDYRSERSISTFEGHNEGVSSLKTIDQNGFFSGSWDKSIRLWDVRKMRMIDCFETEQEVNSVDCYRDILFAGGEMLQIWRKGILVDEGFARAKRVKVVPGLNKVLVGSFDNSVSLFKYLI